MKINTKSKNETIQADNAINLPIMSGFITPVYEKNSSRDESMKMNVENNHNKEFKNNRDKVDLVFIIKS
ncbi:MAG: hypothetical protein ACTSRA_08520 [Promethearchaeota archaeon]